MGPLQRSFPPIHVSPVGLVPKSQPNQWCMIVELSYLRNHSVNNGISRKLSSISYASVDDAVDQILQLERETQLVKFDLERLTATSLSTHRNTNS